MAERHAATVIGAGTFVRGRVTGSGNIEIAGRIEGDVTSTGDVLVEASGLVGAGISARRIVVRGAVKGDLVAEDAVLLEAGARVVGDLRAPRIAIAPGGLVRGHVQTGAAGAPRARSAQATATRASATVAKAPQGRDRAAPPPAKSDSKKEAPPPRVADRGKAVHRGAAISGTLPRARVGPPPPVVPALKKGTKATQKKR